MKIFVIDGPNLNLLGIREPAIYGKTDYAALGEEINTVGQQLGAEIVRIQSNHEGALIDAIQQAYFDGADGIVMNPGAYTHTSRAIPDALRAVSLPCVEVHISDVDNREDFRRISYIRPFCIATVKGCGTDGYAKALRLLADHLKRSGK